jgi:glycosyltransferase involved in cell wall biosynthesis
MKVDLVVSVKAVPDALLVALKTARILDLPILVDIDDPDLEAQLEWSFTPRRFGKELLRPRRMAAFRKSRSALRGLPTTVSNPTLLAAYGGTVIPHVRIDPGPGHPQSDGPINVAFVGTARPHKGVEVLREAVRNVHSMGFTLTVTDQPPANCAPWESWVGQTSLEDGLELTARAGIVALPSLRDSRSRGQLPVKLVDAMLLGRPVVVSDIEPMPWAVADAGIVISPGSSVELANALVSLRGRVERTAAGARARVRGLELFAVEQQASAFAEACRRAIATAAGLSQTSV